MGDEAVAGGWDELRAAAGDAGPLFQPHHRPWDQRLHLSKPRVPHLQKRGDPSIEGWAFLFLMPASKVTKEENQKGRILWILR